MLDKSEQTKFKIILVGDAGVGKSAICTQLCKLYFLANYEQSYGCEFYSKPIYKFEILAVFSFLLLFFLQDESLKSSMFETYLFGTNFVNITILFVYDITNRETFTKMPEIVKYIESLQKAKTIFYGLVANKLDLYNMHTVKMQEHTQFTQTYDMKSYFTSAKTGELVNECFMNVAATLLGIQDQIPNVSYPFLSASGIVPFQPQSQDSKQPQNDTEPQIIQGNLIQEKKCIIF